MWLPRILLAVLACLATGVAISLGVALVGAEGPEATTRAVAEQSPTEAVPPRAEARALDVLRDWDRRRAAAWSTGSVPDLSALYAPGSVAGRRDARMLGRWVARGMTVQGLRTQVIRSRLMSQRPRRLVLRVTDRVVVATATGTGRPVRLPADAASTRQIELVRRPSRAGVRAGGQWLVAAVYPRPAASTASTSGSANS